MFQEKQARRINSFCFFALIKAVSASVFNINCMCNMADGKWDWRGVAKSRLNYNGIKYGPHTNLLFWVSQNII